MFQRIRKSLLFICKKKVELCLMNDDFTVQLQVSLLLLQVLNNKNRIENFHFITSESCNDI